MVDGAAGPVLARNVGRVGRITLDRPRALNALDLPMVQAIGIALETWRDDPAVHLVVIDASSDRAFCAGGDVRSVRDWVLQGRFEDVDAFFVSEYALNRTIARYNKPYVALIDGLCMGGGIGLSVHGTVRVATERATFAMPEARLGLFPDVGASYFLPRLRGSFGMYLGLTGTSIGAADACWLGLATHFIPHTSLPALVDSLVADGIGALAQFAELPSPPGLSAIQDGVNSVFGVDTLAEVVRRLDGIDQQWATTALSAMRAASPSALQWTFELLRAGADRTFEQCQRAELMLTRRACSHPDFAEGVRAAVVDKDRTPVWQPL